MLTGFENVENLDISPKLKRKAESLLAHIGCYKSDTCITSKSLSSALRISDVELRQLISYMRMHGYPVGSTGKGYYQIRSEKDLELTLSHLKEREHKLNCVINGLENSRKNFTQENKINFGKE